MYFVLRYICLPSNGRGKRNQPNLALLTPFMRLLGPPLHPFTCPLHHHRIFGMVKAMGFETQKEMEILKGTHPFHCPTSTRRNQSPSCLPNRRANFGRQTLSHQTYAKHTQHRLNCNKDINQNHTFNGDEQILNDNLTIFHRNTSSSFDLGLKLDPLSSSSVIFVSWASSTLFYSAQQREKEMRQREIVYVRYLQRYTFPSSKSTLMITIFYLKKKKKPKNMTHLLN